MSVITLTADMPIQLNGELSLRVRRGDRLVVVDRLPLSMFVDAHERQCQRNHGGQTLERIRERGGFGATEALAVLACTFWGDLEAERVAAEYAHRILYQMVAIHNRGMRVSEAAR